MERIFLSRLVGVITLCFMCNICFGQHNYYVFKKQGNPTLNSDNILERGSMVSKSDTLHIGQTDYLLLVNETGELFEMNQPNLYSFSAIADFHKKFESDSFTKKYFAYVWQQFTNTSKKRQETGVVYREERNVKLISPIDSANIFSPEIKFSWNNNTAEKEVFFFLKDLKTGHLTKLGLTGNSIELSLDNFLLQSENDYDWAVSTNAFPNLNKLKFNRFTMLSKDAYEAFEKEIAAIIKAFKLLGFSEADIQEAICLDYKFCTF